MSLIERFAVLATQNPLLASAPRTHATGIELSQPAPARKPRRPWDVDAPRVHLGHAGR